MWNSSLPDDQTSLRPVTQGTIFGISHVALTLAAARHYRSIMLSGRDIEVRLSGVVWMLAVGPRVGTTDQACTVGGDLPDRPTASKPVTGTDLPDASSQGAQTDAGGRAVQTSIRSLVRRFPYAEGLPLPSYATTGAVRMDLLAAVGDPATITLGDRALIPTGLTISLHPGYELRVS